MATRGYPTAGALPKNITTSTNTQVKTGAGIYFGLTVNTGQSGASITLYDGTDNTGVKLGAYTATAQASLPLPAPGVQFTVGLFAVTAGGSPADITVYYY